LRWSDASELLGAVGGRVDNLTDVAGGSIGVQVGLICPSQVVLVAPETARVVKKVVLPAACKVILSTTSIPRQLIDQLLKDRPILSLANLFRLADKLIFFIVYGPEICLQ
jgi:hypothetical protein